MAELSDQQVKIEKLIGSAEELRWTVSRLQLQLQQTRAVMVGAATWVFGLFLAASVFTPIIKLRPYDDDDPESYSIVRVIGAGLGAKTRSGESDPDGSFYGITFLVLLLVVLVSLHRLQAIGGRKATKSTFTSLTAAVLLFGTAGAWLTLLLDVKRSWWQLEPGIFLLTIGALGFAVLALWSRARPWWIVPAGEPLAGRSFRDLSR
ncbi:membrane associated rhomboid family serine protease [Nakamurella sp. UYEF19]|uniref:hypothetical protein n=1 Tax=Nakamurella sp. UYEF19 TaxID=1756392 RepID=UPI00339536F4